jgi:cell division protein FtsL
LTWRMESKLKNRIFITMLAAALVCTLIYVRVRINMYHLSYNINSNMKIEKELMEENRKLRIESASLRAPSRVGKIAQEKLNLKLDGKGRTVLIDKNEAENK